MASYSVNHVGVEHARKLIDSHQYVLRSEWGQVQPGASEENAFREKHSWEEYAAWFLGLTDGAQEQTKARYAFVYGDFRRLHRMGLIAVCTGRPSGATRRSSSRRTTSCSGSTRRPPKRARLSGAARSFRASGVLEDVERAEKRVTAVRYGSDARVALVVLRSPTRISGHGLVERLAKPGWEEKRGNELDSSQSLDRGCGRACGRGRTGGRAGQEAEEGCGQDVVVCKHGCRYNTIQKAVNASGPNATINVKPGKYVEGVIVQGHRHDGLHIIGAGKKPSAVLIEGKNAKGPGGAAQTGSTARPSTTLIWRT